MEKKKCCSCKKLLPYSEYHKCKTHSDGFSSKCKKCTHNYRVRYYRKHRETAINNTRKWQLDNPNKTRDYKSKCKSKRRKLGFNKLKENDWYEPIDWHHVNDNDVVPLPRYLHRMTQTGDTSKHRRLTNRLIKILYDNE